MSTFITSILNVALAAAASRQHTDVVISLNARIAKLRQQRNEDNAGSFNSFVDCKLIRAEQALARFEMSGSTSELRCAISHIEHAEDSCNFFIN